MSTIQKGMALVGVADQSAKGTPAAAPKYAHALSGGAPVAVEIEQEPLEVTSGDREKSGALRTGIAPAFGPVNFPAYLNSLGVYLLGAYGDVVDAGTAGAYTHTYAAGDELPYLTVWSLLDAESQILSDVKISELGFSWEGSKPVDVSVNGPACAVTPYVAPASTWELPAGAGADETKSESILIPTGGIFKIAGTGDSPATAIITGGEIKITNELEPVPNSASLLPGVLAEKMIGQEVSLKVVPEDLGLWRTILTGGASTATLQNTVAYGSFELGFKVYGAGAESASGLTLRAHKVAFLCSFPDVDPAGGYAELDMAGVCYKTTVAEADYPGITPVLTNAIAAYGS